MLIVLFNFLSSLVGGDEIRNFGPVAEPMPVIEKVLLFKAFEEHELFIGCPVHVEEREIEFIDNIVFGGKLTLIGKAGRTVIFILGEHFGRLADVPLAVVALNLVGRVHDVLYPSTYT